MFPTTPSSSPSEETKPFTSVAYTRPRTSVVPESVTLACYRTKRICCDSCVLKMWGYLAFIFLFSAGIYLLEPGWTMQTEMRSALKIIPTEREWNRYLQCVDDPKCNLCEIPMITLMRPVKRKVALLSVRGTWGTPVRLWMQSATRVRTGIDDCFREHQRLGKFDSECANSFFFPFYSVTRFMSAFRMGNYARLDMDALIFLTRNPFKVGVSAYHFEIACGGYVTMGCLARGAQETDFLGVDSTFTGFMRRHIKEWVDAYVAYEAFNGPKMILYAEDLERDKFNNLHKILNFTANAVGDTLAAPERAIACGMADTDVYTKRYASTPVERVYTPEFRKELCGLIGKRWNSEKWGIDCERIGGLVSA